MSYDITTEINTIRNNIRGEDVRDAIITLFQAANESSIGVTLTTAEYNALTPDEKLNGTMYFVSDMSIEDGEEHYYGEDVGTATHVLITKETALAIANMARSSGGITANVKLAHVPNLVLCKYMFVEPLHKLLIDSYNSGKNWNYAAPTSNPQYAVDIYPLEANKTYQIGIGALTGSRFYVSFFSTDPSLATESMSNGTSYYSMTYPSAFQNVVRTTTEAGFVAIFKSNDGNTAIPTYCVDTSEFGKRIVDAYGEDEYEEEGD